MMFQESMVDSIGQPQIMATLSMEFGGMEMNKMSLLINKLTFGTV